MKLHHIKPAPGSRKSRVRVGRGDRGRRPKTAGRGTKGTGARGTVPAGFEGGQLPLKIRQPKMPGFTRHNPPAGYTVINVGRLERWFEADEEVTSATLVRRGLVKRGYPVKVLGHGELTKPLTVGVDAISASARRKITEAGGTIVE